MNASRDTTQHPEQQIPETIEECEALLPKVEEELASLRSKLEHVRARRVQTGEYADPDWYRRTSTRLRFRGLFHQQLTRKLAELRKASRQAHNARFESAFISIAREHLDATTYGAIRDAAAKRVAAS